MATTDCQYDLRAARAALMVSRTRGEKVVALSTRGGCGRRSMLAGGAEVSRGSGATSTFEAAFDRLESGSALMDGTRLTLDGPRLTLCYESLCCPMTNPINFSRTVGDRRFGNVCVVWAAERHLAATAQDAAGSQRGRAATSARARWREEAPTVVSYDAGWVRERQTTLGVGGRAVLPAVPRPR